MKLRATRAALVAALLASACGKNHLAQTHSQILVTPAALSFGDVPQLFPASLNLTIQNGGQAALEIETLTIDGAQASMFSAAAAPTDPIEPSATFVLAVSFTPSAAGPAVATLHIGSNDPATPVLDVPLSGSGSQGGSLAVMPSSLAFGRVGEGESQVLPLTLQSLGPGSLYIASLTIAPASMGFALVGAVQTPAALGANQSAQIALRYSPLPGAEATQGTLTIVSSDPANPTVQIPLTASFNQAPIAVATAQIPPAAPQAPETGALSAAIGATVLLDASGSTDPDGDVPLTYAWTLTSRPEGSAAALGSATAVSTQVVLDVAGVYTVELSAIDATGLPSISPATLSIQALPPTALTIELSWDELRPDLDLHLLQQPGAPLGSTSDCGWTNPDPAWFPGGADDNPRFEGDALVGYGPEIIDWKTPQSGTFGIAVVYTNANGLVPQTTNARIRVIAYGVLVGDLSAPLTTQGQVWNAGTVSWPGAQVIATPLDGGTGQ